MQNSSTLKAILAAMLVSSAIASVGISIDAAPAAAQDDDDRQAVTRQQRVIRLATGQFVTPTAAEDSVQQFLNPGLVQYPDFVAGMAVRSQLSPDGTTLAILCAGQNSLVKPDGSTDVENSTQYIFLYDVAGKNRREPVLKQVLKQTNAHVGLAFSPDGNTLYATGGADDAVYVYTKSGDTFVAQAPIALGHAKTGLGIGVQPNASGLGISADGSILVVANNYNDSISVIDTATRSVLFEHDLRPFAPGNEGTSGGVGGTFPYAVVVKGDETGYTAYVSSDRDREVVAINIASGTGGELAARIKLDGNGLGMALNADQTRLYVAQDNADQVAVIDTNSNEVIDKIDARAPARILDRRTKYTGAVTSAVTLSRDENLLFAVNSGSNSVAVIPLTGPAANRVVGLIPTAYEPHDITLSADGRFMYIVNGKSTGPNPEHFSSYTDCIGASAECANPLPENVEADNAARASNQYQFQLERASLISAPLPDLAELGELTDQVARNNFYTKSADAEAKDQLVMSFLRRHIKHVIYVVRENRTFDQVLGDLTNGANADPALTQFGEALTPNLHRLANGFVTLDNFTNPGDGSMDGWSWAMQGRVTNTEALTQQINYSFVSRGLSYESEGSNRNVPVNYETVAERDEVAGPAGTTNYSDATAGLPGGTENLLTGSGNHASTDAPFGDDDDDQDGYIFNAVLDAGLTVRNYGFLVNNIGSIGTKDAPISDPYAAGEIQVAPLEPALADVTDVYFRGYDQRYPDLWRFDEWKREFDQYVAYGNLPSLSMVRISHDHMGSFGSALAGVDTPEEQQADCDLATGLLVEAVANSPYAKDTLIIITMDDVQDGPDHVDSHRGPALVVGPYVKQGGVVISNRYTQVNALRTIEDVLGTEHMNLNTAFQRPMTDVFDLHSDGQWHYVAVASTVLKGTQLASAETKGQFKFAEGPTITPKHDAAYWDRVTAGFNFAEADMAPTAKFNRVLWAGLMGDKPYPALRGPASRQTEID